MIDLAMGWYTPSTWRELQAIPEAKITMSYSQFVRKVKRMTAEFEAEGINLVHVPINVSQMVKWCHKHGYEVDTRGRAAYGGILTLALGEGRNVMDVPVTDLTRTV